MKHVGRIDSHTLNILLSLGVGVLMVILIFTLINSQQKHVERTPQEECSLNGGFWNECGSACAGKVTQFCTMQCVAQCECGFEDYKCPREYLCRQEKGAERGVCISEGE